MPYDSASKLNALQTLRAAAHPQKPSQLANNCDLTELIQTLASHCGTLRPTLDVAGEAVSTEPLAREVSLWGVGAALAGQCSGSPRKAARLVRTERRFGAARPGHFGSGCA